MRRSLTLLAAALGACGGSGDEPADTSTVEDGVPIDGFVLMQRTDGANYALHLVDPASGKHSEVELRLVGAASWAIAPDGSRVALVRPEADFSSTLVIAEPSLASGAPELAIVKEIDNVPPFRNLAWTGDGERIYSSGGWVDLSSDAVYPCGRFENNTDYLTVAPGSHRYACMADEPALFDDGRFITPIAGALGAASPDGQTLGGGLHVASGATRPIDQKVGFDYGWGLSTKLTRGPTNEQSLRVSGVHGQYVTRDVNSDGGWVYHLESVVEPPGPIAIYDLAETLADGSWEPDHSWDLDTALMPFFGKGDGRRFEVIGFSADGERAIVVVSSHVIVNTGLQIVESPIDYAVVEVPKSGAGRGFTGADLGDEGPRVFSFDSFVDLGDGDWLIAAGGTQEPHMVGFVGGEATMVSGVSRGSPDGRWLYGLGPSDDPAKPGRLCFRARTDPTKARCVDQTSLGEPVGFFGQGTKPEHAGDGPVLVGMSQAVAPLGGVVVLHGARFGTSGTVTVGDVTVPSADVVSWSDRQVRIRMSDALPVVGRVRVGTAGDARPFLLGKTARISNPFDGVKEPSEPIGQGFNILELGDFVAEANSEPRSYMVHPDLRLDDGRYVFLADGSATGEAATALLSSGPWTRVLRLDQGDRLADPTHWQLAPIDFTAITPKHVGLMNIGPDLFDRKDGQSPTLDPRLRLRPLRVNTVLPGEVRKDGDHTWIAYRTGGFGELDDWVVYDGIFGDADLASEALLIAPIGRHVAAIDDQVIAVGAGVEGCSAWAFSENRGESFGATTLATAEQLEDCGLALFEPVAVHAQSGAFYLVLEATPRVAVVGVHGISSSGVLTPDIAAVPPGASVYEGAAAAWQPPSIVATNGGLVLMHFWDTQTVARIDFDGAKSWSVVPGADDEGHIRSFYEVPTTHDIVAVRDDGTLAKSTLAGGWNDWAPLDLGLDLPIATRVVTQAIGQVNGRWIVAADLFDARPGAGPDDPSVFGYSGWLIGPE